MISISNDQTIKNSLVLEIINPWNMQIAMAVMYIKKPFIQT